MLYEIMIGIIPNDLFEVNTTCLTNGKAAVEYFYKTQLSDLKDINNNLR